MKLLASLCLLFISPVSSSALGQNIIFITSFSNTHNVWCSSVRAENEFCVTYIFEIVCVFVFVYLWVCVCVFAYSSRTEQPIYTKLGILVASDQRRFYKGQNPGKLSCVRVPARAESWETKNNRRTAPRSKLFASTRWLQEQIPQPWKIILDLCPGKDIFCNSETNQNTRMTPRPKLFVSAWRLQEFS